jgi:hypothetical protein
MTADPDDGDAGHFSRTYIHPRSGIRVRQAV